MLSDDELLTLKELADYVKLKPRTVSIKLRRGELPGFKFLKKSRRVRKSKIDQWLLENVEARQTSDKNLIHEPQQPVESQS